MIARYTRPEIGAVWTDEARFGAMRDVEVAAAEALDGPTPEELDAIRAATFTVEAIDEREKILDHDTAAFVDVLAASAGPAGPLDPLRADVLRRGRHRDGAAAQARGRAARPRGAHAGVGAGREGARARRDAVRRPHPRRPRRADQLRAQARRLRDGDAPQRRAPGARVRADHRARSPAPSAPTRRSGPTTRSASPRSSGCATRTSPPRSCHATATRSCCPRSR